MKFEEKLVKLRKENAFSQEELGEKLNVTRQTVSKWELGQTKPDSEKIMEIAKIFNISVDELLNESEQTEENEKQKEGNINIHKPNTRNTIIIVTLLIILVLVVIAVTYKVINDNKIKENAMNFISNVSNKISNGEMAEDYNDAANQIIEGYNNKAKQMQEEHKREVDKMNEDYAISSYNNKYKNLYSGLKEKFFVEAAIKAVIQDNLNNKRKITVKYKKTTANESKELTKLISKLNKKQYLITYDYDKEGYIRQMNIADV